MLSGAVLLAPQMVLAQTSGSGGEMFNALCAHCHGSRGEGGALAPSMLPRVAMDSDEALAGFLRTGVPAKGMPPVVLDDEQLAALLAHLRTLTAGMQVDASGVVTDANPYASMTTIGDFEPVSDDILLSPDPADWLWFSRTADAQRFSPLAQINRDNVDSLQLSWSRSLPAGITETIPTVYDGVMYLTMPGGTVAALDASTGDEIWHYERRYDNASQGVSARSKTLAIYDDMVYFTAPDETIVALDARTGALRWEASVEGRGNTSGAIAIGGRVYSGGTCFASREACYISAHDAWTGELIWRFNTAQSPDDPSFDPEIGDTWAGVPVENRRAASWGLPGSYDSEHNILYWSVANPSPYTRLERHGSPDVAPMTAPVDLYSNSTLALDPESGELLWYYQHLPGDDWDMDMNQERVLLSTAVNPDPQHVRWISPAIAAREDSEEERSISVNIGEGGGLWALDSRTGEFLWATPFPEPTENFLISDIDLSTGATEINRALLMKEPGDHHIICYFNTRSYWPGAYHPGNNSLYMPYIKNCLNMTAATPASADMPAMPESRIGIAAPGVPESELNGLAKINMETGEITQWPRGPIPTTSAILATAGNLILMGDINRRYWAMDADSGEVLWSTILGGPISVGNISYAVDGRQYVAVITGENLSHGQINDGDFAPIRLNLRNSYGSNTLYVFALPD